MAEDPKEFDNTGEKEEISMAENDKKVPADNDEGLGGGDTSKTAQEKESELTKGPEDRGDETVNDQMEVSGNGSDRPTTPTLSDSELQQEIENGQKNEVLGGQGQLSLPKPPSLFPMPGLTVSTAQALGNNQGVQNQTPSAKASGPDTSKGAIPKTKVVKNQSKQQSGGQKVCDLRFVPVENLWQQQAENRNLANLLKVAEGLAVTYKEMMERSMASEMNLRRRLGESGSGVQGEQNTQALLAPSGHTGGKARGSKKGNRGGRGRGGNQQAT